MLKFWKCKRTLVLQNDTLGIRNKLEDIYITSVTWRRSSVIKKCKVIIAMPMIDSERISTEDQKEHQSGVGMLLLLLKHSRSDVATDTREFSNANDVASIAAF